MTVPDPAATPPRPRRILADVDTGIDDACALLHLAGAEQLGLAEIAAVTVTGGNAVENGARLRAA